MRRARWLFGQGGCVLELPAVLVRPAIGQDLVDRGHLPARNPSPVHRLVHGHRLCRRRPGFRLRRRPVDPPQVVVAGQRFRGGGPVLRHGIRVRRLRPETRRLDAGLVVGDLLRGPLVVWSPYLINQLVPGARLLLAGFSVGPDCGVQVSQHRQRCRVLLGDPLMRLVGGPDLLGCVLFLDRVVGKPARPAGLDLEDVRPFLLALGGRPEQHFLARQPRERGFGRTDPPGAGPRPGNGRPGDGALPVNPPWLLFSPSSRPAPGRAPEEVVRRRVHVIDGATRAHHQQPSTREGAQRHEPAATPRVLHPPFRVRHRHPRGIPDLLRRPPAEGALGVLRRTWDTGIRRDGVRPGGGRNVGVRRPGAEAALTVLVRVRATDLDRTEADYSAVVVPRHALDRYAVGLPPPPVGLLPVNPRLSEVHGRRVRVQNAQQQILRSPVVGEHGVLALGVRSPPGRELRQRVARTHRGIQEPDDRLVGAVGVGDATYLPEAGELPRILRVRQVVDAGPGPPVAVVNHVLHRLVDNRSVHLRRPGERGRHVPDQPRLPVGGPETGELAVAQLALDPHAAVHAGPGVTALLSRHRQNSPLPQGMEVRLFRRVHGIVRVPVVREHHRPRLTQPLIGHHVPGQGVMELHRHIGGFHPEGAVVVLRTGDTPRNRSVGTRPGPQPAGVPIRPRPSVQRAVKSVQIETGTDRQTVGRGLGPVTGAEHDLPRGTASRGAQRRVDIGPQPTQVPRSDPPRGFAHLRAVEPALDGRPAPPVGVRGPHQRTVGVHRTHALPRTVAVLVMEPEQVPDLVRERPLRGVQAPRKGMCPPGRVVRSDDVVSEVGAADELQLHVQRIPVGEAQAATVVVGVHAVLGPLRQLVDLSVPCLGQNRVGLRVCHQMDLHHQPGEHLAVVRPTVPLDVVAPDAQ